ncbi:MAG: ATP-binding protein [Desulfovibrio sp.]
MRLTTRLTLLISSIAFLLIGITGLVYQQSYNALETRITLEGHKLSAQMANQLHSNFNFIDEDLKLYLISLGFTEVYEPLSFNTVPSEKDLITRFITFFEFEYGNRLYEKVFITNETGQVVTSTDYDYDNYENAEWWKEAVATGKSYSLGTDSSGTKTFNVALAITNNEGKLLGVIRADSSISAIIRRGGLLHGEIPATRVDLLTIDGRILYSTEFHQVLAETPSQFRVSTHNQSKSVFIRENQFGHKELVIVQPHNHSSDASFKWMLVFYYDYNTLFQPVLQLRWWMLGGTVALLILAAVFFVLVKGMKSSKEHETILIQKEQLLKTILEGIGAAVFFIDRETLNIVWANPHATKLLGLDNRKFINSPCYEFICKHPCNVQNDGCPAADTPHLHTEFELNTCDGKKLPVTKTVLHLDIDNRPHLIEIIFDITQRKEIERQLAHAQKMEGLGTLAAGIAHEINTPSQYITQNLTFVEQAFEHLIALWEKIKETPSCAEIVSPEADIDFYMEESPIAIKQSQEGIERITAIVLALKKFSHPGASTKQLADINATLENTALICKNEWKYTATLDLNLSPDLPEIPCHINDLSQVFLNMIINASHAITEKLASTPGEKGKITITTFSNKNHAIITIDDTGTGIPPEIIDKIFDPFFTTKEVGAGTGQGLAIAYNIIVDKHGGGIEIDNLPDGGTRFIITLPIKPAVKNNLTRY